MTHQGHLRIAQAVTLQLSIGPLTFKGHEGLDRFDMSLYGANLEACWSWSQYKPLDFEVAPDSSRATN